MPGKVILHIVEGILRGRNFAFEEHDTFLFGRAGDCHANLSIDDCVSRYHFILEANPPDARLRDLGSMNGTYVNQQLIGSRAQGQTPEEGSRKRHPYVDLNHGDIIHVGETAFTIEVYDDKTAAPREAVEICQVCGSDVSTEFGNRRGGAYICRTCRSKAMEKPGDVLGKLSTANDPNSPSLAEYDLVKTLGEGGMGTVYLARHKETGQQVALKVILSRVSVDEIARQRFTREMNTLRSLQHPNIVAFRGSGYSGGAFYFMMEHCEGGSLDRILKQHKKPLPLAKALPIIRQTLSGLEHAHAKGFVHRDIKPQNILLSHKGEDGQAKLCDFGLAKNFERAGFSGMTATGTYGGTFHFMPREQITDYKYVKASSDVWSLGATFYYMLTGHVPRDFREGQDPLQIILNDEIVPIQKRTVDLPELFVAVINKSIAKKVEDRFPTAAEFRHAVEVAANSR